MTNSEVEDPVLESSPVCDTGDLGDLLNGDLNLGRQNLQRKNLPYPEIP